MYQIAVLNFGVNAGWQESVAAFASSTDAVEEARMLLIRTSARACSVCDEKDACVWRGLAQKAASPWGEEIPFERVRISAERGSV